jgi:AraC-like DNA-binding protein
MDVFSDVLRQLSLRGSAYFCSDLHGAWGMEESATEHASFHIVMRGQAWLQVNDEEVHSLGPGDIVLLPHGDAHWLANHPDNKRLPGTQTTQAIQQGQSPFSEGQMQATLLCGYFQYDTDAPHPLLNNLPKLVKLETDNLDDRGWLVSAVHALSAEARDPKPGMEVMLDRLTEVVIIEVLRRWLQTYSPNQGLLSALTDRRLARALEAMHEQPGENWSLISLAQQAGMSRASFAKKFLECVGETPMAYLTNWRMILALKYLETNTSILDVALSLGYQSDAAFSKAFKKVTGMTPGAARRMSSAE